MYTNVINNTVNDDINRILENKELFDSLKNSTILVTGATGLIGSMLIKTLHCANIRLQLGINIVGQIRNEEKAQQIFGDLIAGNDICLTKNLNKSCNYIIHTLSPTASRYFVEHPVETIYASVNSTQEVLETAIKYNASTVYLSSMEQYGIPYHDNEVMTEDKIGIIDHLNIRSSYSESKRLCECLCASYAAEYGLNVTIARLAQTFGAGVPLSDNRMPMQFARAALKGEDIVLHTKGNSVSNFVYLSDAITGILTVLLKGATGNAYNICNDSETRSVKDIALLVANTVSNRKVGVRIDIPESMNFGYAPETHMYLSSEKLKKIGWKPVISMEEGYGILIRYLKEEQERTAS